MFYVVVVVVVAGIQKRKNDSGTWKSRYGYDCANCEDAVAIIEVKPTDGK